MMRAYAAGLCVVAVTAFVVPWAQAQTERYVTATKRVTKAQRPVARVTVPPRSFLDPGTEVKPGERKFTDYAFPPGYPSSTGTVTNIGGKVGSARDPFMEPFQLPGFSYW